MDFNVFKTAVAAQFEHMQKHQLFRVNVSKDSLWETYLNSFETGTNPIYRERAEHDCNCCKQFIRAIGNVVAVIDGKIQSIWDIKVPKEPGYQVVANALSALVKNSKVSDKFLHYERTAGTDKTFEHHITGMKTWQHFFVNIPAKFVMKNADIATSLGESRALRDVLLRSLNEITDESIENVLELIAQNSLYRGEEQKFVVDSFRKLKKQFKTLSDDIAKDMFAWSQSEQVPVSVAKIRNSAIGTLLTDLSEGKELEGSVASFEAKVAPMNYKRPTALVTGKMIAEAKEKLATLGLTSALERRHARLTDITINNILFADRSASKIITGDVFDELSNEIGSKVKSQSLDRVEEVSIERFITEILPKASSLEVMIENTHTSNFMSLIAPVDPTAGSLFKWNNNFSWSYVGEVADSIKERVKKAGGSVVGDLCCRLAWFNHDDLDFHMKEPDGNEIYFGNRGRKSACGGELDVDMNAGGGTTRTPVENIFYESKSHMKEGVYTLIVNQWAPRETNDVGFEVEIDMMGEVLSFSYNKAMRSRENVTVAKIKYTKAEGFQIVESLPSSKSVRTVNGLPTQSFAKVNVMMLSPNYWDEQVVGNKHYFFMLDRCTNDGTARGFFNEFLKEDLNVHRKVFEMVGSKMKVDDSMDQLSGLGFSSTQKNTLICRVKGSFTRTIKIVF